MKIIKMTALILCFSLLFALSSCKKDISSPETTLPEENTGEMQNGEQTTVQYINEETTAPTVVETTAPAVETTAPAIIETTAPAVTEEQTEAPSEPAAEDVSAWDIEKTVAFYKAAAEKTGSAVSSSQIVELSDISVNNGALGGMFSFVTPVLSKFLSSKATVTQGITGDFMKLCADDVVSAKAYKAAGGTAVEITLKEQSGNASEGTDGSVAHGISIVGDLGSVMTQLKGAGLPIEISVEKAIISYSEPVIKVIVDENGRIINGRWSCTMEISLSDYTFAGAKVDSTRVVLKNIITVNDGFKI
ncbi:MAG: hypothetical protein E7535_00250 [Ruminococcaceae bacterium]|nr:hypothetical protein [Oscillospiraceae bacterium]